MMRIMKVLVLIIVIAAAAGGYLYLHPEFMRLLLQGTPLEPPAAETQLYKWRDASGKWQVSDIPPVAGIKYETLQYRSDVNVIPALPEKKKD